MSDEHDDALGDDELEDDDEFEDDEVAPEGNRAVGARARTPGENNSRHRGDDPDGGVGDARRPPCLHTAVPNWAPGDTIRWGL